MSASLPPFSFDVEFHLLVINGVDEGRPKLTLSVDE